MATGFTDTEIADAVARYVQSDLRINQSPLGPTDAQSKFGEVRALFATTLIFDPNAVFYLIYLASNKLNATIKTTLEYLDDLLTAIDEMGKKTQDVTNTTPLGDAAAALLMVDQILTDKNAISYQAYVRYQTSVTKFISQSLKPNIQGTGVVVRPPQRARQDAITDLAALAAAYKSILADAAQLQTMLSDFMDLNLPVLAIQDSVRKVRADLQTVQSSFSTAQTKDARISLCRDAYLAIVAGKSVLDNYTTITDPSEPRLSSLDATGSVAMPDGELGVFTAASVSGTKSAPWAMVPGVSDQLVIVEDGHASTTYTVGAPSLPSVRCYIAEPYAISVGVNDLLEVDELPITLDAASTTATDIVGDINDWVSADPTNRPYSAAVVDGCVEISKTTTGFATITLTAVANHAQVVATYLTFGFYEGQSDSNRGVSGDEVADVINGIGKVRASLQRTFFEQGTTGEVIDPTTIDLPLNSLGSLSHTDDQLIIRSGVNTGYHRIVSVTRSTVDRVVVSADTPFLDTVSNQNWLIFREILKLESTAGDLTSRLVIGSGTANALVGLSAGTIKGATTGFRATTSGADVDFTRADVVVGDTVSVTVGTTTTTHTVLELTSDNEQLELTPSLAVDAVVASFHILSAAAVAHAAFLEDMANWEDDREASEYDTDILELERVMNPLLANAHPSLAQINDARVHAEALDTLLSDLSAALVGFVVAPVGRMDAALKMLKERGMDRAYDVLMKGLISDFFGMDKDDAASSSYMLKSMRAIAQLDLPVSKLDDDIGEAVVQSTSTGTDADYDYSDQDRDENLRILGEVPDFDNPNDAAATKYERY